MVSFLPNDRLDHSGYYSFSLPLTTFSGSRYPKNVLFNFEKGSTVEVLLPTNLVSPRLLAVELLSV